MTGTDTHRPVSQEVRSHPEEKKLDECEKEQTISTPSSTSPKSGGEDENARKENDRRANYADEENGAL